LACALLPIVRTLVLNQLLPPTAAVVIVALVVESPLPAFMFALLPIALSPLARAPLLAFPFFPFAPFVTIPIAIVLLIIIPIAVIAPLREARPGHA